MTASTTPDSTTHDVERLTRPIVGLENRTPQEVFDIMADRIRYALSSEAAAAAQDGAVGVKAEATHPDDDAVDRFAAAMKAKLKWEREECGRHGWDDPAVCSEEYLTRLLIEHLAKGNEGNLEDVANFCMMLHQRGAHPRVLADALTSPSPAQERGKPDYEKARIVYGPLSHDMLLQIIAEREAGIAFASQSSPSPAQEAEGEPVESLDERMEAAGMIPLSKLLSGDTPLSRWEAHTGVRSIEAFKEWVNSKHSEYMRMRMRYELGDVEKDELYEWIFAHAGAFSQVAANLRQALSSSQLDRGDEWEPSARLDEIDRLLRASVPEPFKSAASPVGAVQGYIAELEGRIMHEAGVASVDVEKIIETIEYDCFSSNDGTSGSLGERSKELLRSLLASSPLAWSDELVAMPENPPSHVITAALDEIPPDGSGYQHVEAAYRAIRASLRAAARSDGQ